MACGAQVAMRLKVVVDATQTLIVSNAAASGATVFFTGFIVVAFRLP